MITGFYAAILSFLLIALSVNVIKGRHQHKIALGDNNIYEIQKRVRAHSNFTEYTPIFLILLGILEYLELPDYGLHLLGLVFFSARLSHAYGMCIAERFEGDKPLNLQHRIRGMAGTFIALSIGASLVFYLVIMKFLA